MVKKIKKYLKFVVCCALILSLIAPSYAALSASDGSAFVTKAEFDSALADFNARLTTFEAGINSKIDSQVSSYLDRNGIWNGQAVQFYNMNPGQEYNIDNYMLPTPYILNGSGGKTYKYYLYYTQNHTGIAAGDYDSDDDRFYSYPDVETNGELLMDFGTNDGLLKTYFDNVKNPAWNTKYYVKSNSSGQNATYATGYSSADVLSAVGTFLCGEPTLIVQQVQKSGLLFLTIRTGMKNDSTYKRYGGQLYFVNNELSQHSGGLTHMGHNAGTSFNFTTTSFLCTTANPATKPTAANYQQYVQNSFNPITLTMNSRLQNWNTVMAQKQTTHYMRSIVENSYLSFTIGFVPNMYLMSFFVKKGEAVWLVPTIGHSISAATAASMVWGMDIAYFWNGNVSFNNTISMSFNGDIY